MSERTETALRDAIHAYTDGVDASLDAWEQIEQRIHARQRLRGRPAAAVVGAVAVVASIAIAVVGFALLRDDGGGPTASSGAHLPDRIVSVIDGSLVVLDSGDGHVVRTLTGAGQPGSPTVGANGYVYFSRHPAQCEIARVRLTGGRPDVVGHGLSPRVSPNGRWLAILSGAIGPCDGYIQRLNMIDLRTGQSERVIQVVTGQSTFEFLSWSPSSRYLLVRTVPDGDDSPATYEVDLVGDRSRSFVAAGPGVPTTYLGTTGLFVEAGSSLDGQFTIAAFDPATGERRRRLLRWSEGYVQRLTSDASGRHLLYWVSRGQRTLELWRKSVGERPVRLRTERAHASGGLPAVWVP